MMRENAMVRCLLVLTVVLSVGVAHADVIELKTGQRVEGTLKQATPASVSVEVGGQTITFEGGKVRAIYFGTAPASNVGATSTIPVVAAVADAIQALKGLRSVTGAGIAYREYATRVLDAKPKVDRYIEEAEPSPARESIARAMRYHVAASTAWNAVMVKNILGFNGLEAQLTGCQDDRSPKPLDQIRFSSTTSSATFSG